MRTSAKSSVAVQNDDSGNLSVTETHLFDDGSTETVVYVAQSGTSEDIINESLGRNARAFLSASVAS